MWLEINNVEKGIIHIIEEHKIRWLVMGAAAETHYSKYDTFFFFEDLSDV